MKKYKLTDFPEFATVQGINGQLAWEILGPDGQTPIMSSFGHDSRSAALKLARKWRRENFEWAIRIYEKRKQSNG